MAISPRMIKRRIKSVRSTGKMMKAMELVAASKMRKAVQFALASRPYEKLILSLSTDLREALPGVRDPLLRGNATRSSLRTLVLVIASDRGLCGAFNSQVLRKGLEFLRGRGSDALHIVSIGHRAERGVRRAGYTIDASFPSMANAPSFANAQPILRYVLQEFQSGNVDRVFVAYTDFKSALTQIPAVMQLLPIMPEAELATKEAVAESLEEQEGSSDRQEKKRMRQEEKILQEESNVLFEPSPISVLSKLLPRLVETRLYQTLLESAASEQSARMMAMRSAGEAARDMVKDLTLVLNQARQAAITREISEISAGKAAIE